MYENEAKRERTLGRIVGVPIDLVTIFTSRIPEKIVKLSESGRERVHNGDKKIIPILDRLYDLQGSLKSNSIEEKNLKNFYQLQAEKDAISYERFVLLEYLYVVFPQEKTSISEVRVKFPSEVDIASISKEEVMVLYNWIYCDKN